MNRGGLGISSAEISGLMAGLVAAPDFEVTEQAALEAFATVAWSVICEPGDGFAGLLCQGLGHARALELEIAETSAPRLMVELKNAGVDVSKYGDFGEVLGEARQRWKSRKSLALVTQSIGAHKAVGGQILTPQSKLWPTQLRDLSTNSPNLFWFLGQAQKFANLSAAAAVVGSRICTGYGEAVTAQMVETLVAERHVVVSGGAYGIDAIAHRAALALEGETVAVMAGGLNRLYPSGNIELLKRIISSGLLISEMPPGTAPSKWRFLQRNRLIAALGKATLLTEAGWRSGAVNTANQALKLERSVGAIPGPINSPSSHGCNELIRSSQASLISSASDLRELIGVESFDMTPQLAGLGSLETRAFDAIGFDEVTTEQAAADAGLSTREVSLALSGLELAGLIERHCGLWRRAQTTL